jgi:Skp family chaperone for outer membrane proteins
MRIKTATLSLLVLAASALPAGGALADTKVGVVNVSRLLQESPQAQAASQALENEFAGRRRELESQQKALKATEDKLQKEVRSWPPTSAPMPRRRCATASVNWRASRTSSWRT